MRQLWLAVLLAGCGGDPSAEERIQGDWVAPSPKSACAFIASFQGDEYSNGIVCVLENGQAGVQGEWGKFRISGNQLLTTASRATCNDVKINDAVNFSV